MKTISLFLFSRDAYLGRNRGQAYIYKQRNCSISWRHVTWEAIYVDVSFDPHLSRAREGKADFYGPFISESTSEYFYGVKYTFVSFSATSIGRALSGRASKNAGSPTGAVLAA